MPVLKTCGIVLTWGFRPLGGAGNSLENKAPITGFWCRKAKPETRARGADSQATIPPGTARAHSQV